MTSIGWSRFNVPDDTLAPLKVEPDEPALKQGRYFVARTDHLAAIDRKAEEMRLNRRLPFELFDPDNPRGLDPEGIHIVTKVLEHAHAQGEPAPVHWRCRVMIKTKDKPTSKDAATLMVDVPMEFFPPREYLFDDRRRWLPSMNVPARDQLVDFQARRGVRGMTGDQALTWTAPERRRPMTLEEVREHRKALQAEGLVEEAGPDPVTGDMRYRAVVPGRPVADMLNPRRES